jgi:hypothetical protein
LKAVIAHSDKNYLCNDYEDKKQNCPFIGKKLLCKVKMDEREENTEEEHSMLDEREEAIVLGEREEGRLLDAMKEGRASDEREEDTEEEHTVMCGRCCIC